MCYHGFAVTHMTSHHTICKETKSAKWITIAAASTSSHWYNDNAHRNCVENGGGMSLKLVSWIYSGGEF